LHEHQQMNSLLVMDILDNVSCECCLITSLRSSLMVICQHIWSLQHILTFGISGHVEKCPLQRHVADMWHVQDKWCQF
jgi:hypothetical protein